MKRISKRSLSTIADRFSRYVIPAIILLTFVILIAYLFEANRPIKLADIKVPIATDKASYFPGQKVSGIFFGETYYEGSFRILREVFCSNYKGVILPPESNSSGKYYQSQSKYRKLEGQTVVIGYLPSDIPIGSNCVLQFTNLYEIPTIFGERHEEYIYYTQNFSIVTQERRELLDCEASGKRDCKEVATITEYVYQTSEQISPTQTAPVDTQETEEMAPEHPETHLAPVMPPQSCKLGVLGICIVQP